MAHLPLTPPWLNPRRPLDRTKVVVVANSSVDWSLSTCQYYCRERGIPLANIISFALGNGGSPSTTTGVWSPVDMVAVETDFIYPLGSFCRNLPYAAAIILGPGVPAVVSLPTYPDGTGNQYAPLSALASCSIGYPPTWRTPPNARPTNTGGSHVVWMMNGFFSYQLGHVNGIFETNFSKYPGALEGTQASWRLPISDPTFAITHPLHLPTELLGTAGSYDYASDFYKEYHGHPFLPVARLGISSFGGGFAGSPPIAETQTVVLGIINRATAAMRAHTHAGSLARPIVFNLTANDGAIKTAEVWAYLRYLCNSWGMNTTYAYYDAGVATTTTEAYAPYAGKAYTQVEVLAAAVAQEYYMLVGGWNNFDPPAIYNPPYSTSWIAQPGAGVIHGPSDGFMYALNGLASNAVCVLTDETHITTGNLDTHPELFYHLLMGFTWLEAGFYANWDGNIPCGDPLFAPYARDGEFGMAKITLDTGGTLLGIGSAPNDGTGDPLRTGAGKLKQWATDLNTMFTELYSDVKVPWTPVYFENTITYLARELLAFASDMTHGTVVVRFKPRTQTAQRLLNFSQGAGVMRLTHSSGAAVLLSLASVSGTIGVTPSVVLASGISQSIYTTLHVVFTGTAVRCWVNGVESAESLAGIPYAVGNGAIDFSNGAWAGQLSSSTSKLNADVSLFWLVWGAGAGFGITNPRAFYNPDTVTPEVKLGTLGDGPGVRPLIFFGATQNVAAWNAGTNQGNGTGVWTMNGAVT